jgi:glycosyltransferase involved in cell wall biosynthesis
MAGSMRAAVYSDVEYRYAGGVLSVEETFAVFAAGLRDWLDGVVLVGRHDIRPEPHPYRLRSDVEFAALPHYASLARPLSAVAAMARSLRRFWRVLDDVDVVWLLGPHPLAVAFAVLTLARRRRLVLGVRQDMPAHMRARHPDRRWPYLAAIALEAAWRGLARICPTVVVGPDLARRYRHARTLLPISISVVADADVVSAESALTRAYDGELKLLTVGRLDPEKNPLLLVDVLARLRRGDDRWRLIVCGSGSLEAELRDQLIAAGLSAHTELAGFVAADDLRARYRDSHVFLHVSWTEGVPQVLFEAYAAGLPVIATDVGGVAEIAGDASLLIPPGDGGAAATAVQSVADDPVMRERLVRRGLEIAQRQSAGAEQRRVAATLAGESPR